MDYKVVAHEKVFDGQIFNVYHDEVVLEHGRPAVREYIEHGAASCVLPITDDGKLIFVRQYRHPVKERLLEIPAGMVENGEAPEAAALRELEEETGHKAKEIKFLTKMFSSAGFCTEILYIYLAKNLEITKQNLDADEFVSIEEYTLKEATDMVYSGEVKDSKTIVAVMMYNALVSGS
ncbi:MAG: NUDIX hydrolase [Clostridiales bacterium]|jgi:ADP-ribose pyrophosphatase|nr:NUDIX hydrolase [Clostridiales bacterium]